MSLKSLYRGKFAAYAKVLSEVVGPQGFGLKLETVPERFKMLSV
jgi:hypothetical protein